MWYPTAISLKQRHKIFLIKWIPVEKIKKPKKIKKIKKSKKNQNYWPIVVVKATLEPSADNILLRVINTRCFTDYVTAHHIT